MGLHKQNNGGRYGNRPSVLSHREHPRPLQARHGMGTHARKARKLSRVRPDNQTGRGGHRISRSRPEVQDTFRGGTHGSDHQVRSRFQRTTERSVLRKISHSRGTPAAHHRPDEGGAGAQQMAMGGRVQRPRASHWVRGKARQSSSERVDHVETVNSQHLCSK